MKRIEVDGTRQLLPPKPAGIGFQQGKGLPVGFRIAGGFPEAEQGLRASFGEKYPSAGLFGRRYTTRCRSGPILPEPAP